ncbi:Aste57867_20622 [Aphanomyces stellatus]|uniref:Aste57867_20622 protein n=1 Tax=Aphanomyces stellatus TaxID=120398 RepID=A0A485LFZ5_9STRA|nr:hypothetical protein As57867_020554 [Aphanomyces stellatus]VFT97302.1 Aste57867_20622 [Aphanomyces stellatus]
MDREMEAHASAEEPLLNEEERVEGEQRVPYEPPRTEYLGTKLKYFRRLQKDWVTVSPPSKALKHPNVYPPPHVLPPAAFVRGSSEENLAEFNAPAHKYQSTWSTVFSIWNTMIGSTLVALPYGFSCSGVLLGIGIVILVGVICCYTCNLVVYYGRDFADFGDLTQYHFGKRAQVLTLSVSVFVLLGACIAYHVLMKQCAYTVVRATLDWFHVDGAAWTPATAALLVCLLYPLTNLKEFSTLVFLNSFGIPFLLFTIYFITYHGVHVISSHAPMDHIDFGAKSTFGVLGGIVTLSFFIHNAIQPIIRHSNPTYHSRDVTIAYLLVGLSYVVVGVLGYIGFPQGHIQQNFLDAFPVQDVFAFAARLSLLLQLATVYPLFFLIIRTQLFGLVFQNAWPSLSRVMLLNVAIMTTTTLFAIYYPNVGDILRFTGAFGGLVLIFVVPLAIHLKQLKDRRTWPAAVSASFLVLVGLTLLVLQFVTTPNIGRRPSWEPAHAKRLMASPSALSSAVAATSPMRPSTAIRDDELKHTNAFDALADEAKTHAIHAMKLLKQGDFHGGIAAFDCAIEIEEDNWLLWKHLAVAHFELWKHVACAKATLASTWFLVKHTGDSIDPLDLFLRNTYDVFIVAMEYPENKHHPHMLLHLAALYVEYQSFQGALSLCTLILETTRVTSFVHFHEAVFLAAVVARGLHHGAQSGEYFAYLVEHPPYNMRSYRLLLLAGMQYAFDKDVPDSVERSRVLYTEAYQRLTCMPLLSPNASEKKALEIFQTSRQSESERVQLWVADPLLWESLGSDLFACNHPLLASLAFDYAIARGGGRSKDTLVEIGRAHHRLAHLDRAQSCFEQALALDYYAHPTRYWLGVVSFPWCQYFKREGRGALTFQRVYRGHRARVRVKHLRHVRASKALTKAMCAATAFVSSIRARRRVAVRHALLRVREERERGDMHLDDYYLVLQKWNAAARKIQMLAPIYRAKMEKRRRRAWLEKHKALLRRVVSHSRERLKQTCFGCLVEYVDVARQERWDATHTLQRAIRAWLARRTLHRLADKHKAQQRGLVAFLGKTNQRWKTECFNAWRTCREYTKALRTQSAIRIQCCVRSYRARQLFRVNMARQVRVRSFMQSLVADRNALSLRLTFRALANAALAARLYKKACATRIQKVVRGRQGRARAAKVRKRHRHCENLVARALEAADARRVDRTWTQMVVFVQMSKLEKEAAAVTVQRMERGRAARRRAKRRREYLYVYYGRHVPLGYNILQLVLTALRMSRQFRDERQDHAARVIQRAARRRRSRVLAMNMRAKLHKKKQVARAFQTTFHKAAAAFFAVLKAMRGETRAKFDAAARVLQRNLRGWLARRVFARLAKQHRHSSVLMERVINREKYFWKGTVLRLWKAGVAVCRHEKDEACVRIQRKFRARRAVKQARQQMEKRARQRRLVDSATTKPLVRCFQQWQTLVLEKTIAMFDAAKLTHKIPPSFAIPMDKDMVATSHVRGAVDAFLPRPDQDTAVGALPLADRVCVCEWLQSTCLTILVLFCSHGFDRTQLRQLFQLATSVISDAGAGAAMPTAVVDALVWGGESPVQKLILYNEPSLDLVRLARCVESHRLRSLVVGGAALSTRHVTALALALAQPSTKLEQLVLESCHLGNTSAVALALGLAQNRTVWKVDLSGNHIADAACQALGEMLLTNDTLQVVCLNHNNFSDNAVLGTLEPILSSLPAASALQTLQLHGNPRLTGWGAAALERAVAFVNQTIRQPNATPLRVEATPDRPY